MSPENFCFWAQGFFELSGAKSIDEQQVQIFKDHLALVFDKKTPIYWNQEKSGGLASIDQEKTLPPVIYGGVNYSVAAALHPSSRVPDSPGDLHSDFSIKETGDFKIIWGISGWERPVDDYFRPQNYFMFRTAVTDYLSGNGSLNETYQNRYILSPERGYIKPEGLKSFLNTYPQYLIPPFGPNQMLTC